MRPCALGAAMGKWLPVRSMSDRQISRECLLVESVVVFADDLGSGGRKNQDEELTGAGVALPSGRGPVK